MGNEQEYDVAIIGGGPAGLSAALLLGRSCRRVVVFDHGQYRNHAAKQLHGFLGNDGVDPGLFRKKCREELLLYNVQLIWKEVVNVVSLLEPKGKTLFQIQLADGSLQLAKRIIFATGMIDELPAIPGLQECYGQTVHHCPYCDAWEYRGRRVALLSQSKSVVDTAALLTCWSQQLFVCTNGACLKPEFKEQLQLLGIEQRTQKIECLVHQRGVLQSIEFDDGTQLEADALFFSSGQGQRSKLPAKLGCAQEESGRYSCGEKQRSSINGVYIVGDAAKDLQFAVIAAAEGTKAAVAAHKDLLEEELHEILDQAAVRAR